MPHLLYAALCAVAAWYLYPAHAAGVALPALSVLDLLRVAGTLLTGMGAFAGVVNSLTDDAFWPWNWRWRVLGWCATQCLVIALCGAGLWWAVEHFHGWQLAGASVLAGAVVAGAIASINPRASGRLCNQPG